MAWFVFPNATKPSDRAVTCPLDESSFQKAVSDFVVIDIETTGLSLNTDEISLSEQWIIFQSRKRANFSQESIALIEECW